MKHYRLVLSLLSIGILCSGLAYGAAETHFQMDGAVVTIRFPDEKLGMSRNQAIEGIRVAADSLRGYYGRLPVQKITVGIRVREGSDSIHAAAYQHGLIRLRIGSQVDGDTFIHDWTMTHEMIHLAFPNHDRKYLWLEEGMASYLEPIVRAQAGVLTPSQVWAGFYQGFPKGQPETGDQGLDRTPTWGRIYWGGAMFCFLVDLEIRKATHNQKSIKDVVTTILNAGGNENQRWSMDQILRTAQKATHTEVMTDLYHRFGLTPEAVDLKSIWAQLGVSMEGTQIVLDPKAPGAALRDSMTRADAVPVI